MSFLSDLIKFESGGKNVTNINQSTSSGRATGLFQITDGTWRDFGRRVGIDFTKYPTALSAPPELQAQVAGMIPLNRWDPITLRKLSAAGHKFDVNKTLAENAAALGEKMTGDISGAFTGVSSEGSVGAPSAGTPMSGGSPGIASLLGNAFSGMSFGGSGGGGSIGGGSADAAQLGGAADLRTKSPDVPAGPPLDTGKSLALADLFTPATIGKQKPGMNIAAKSWI